MPQCLTIVAAVTIEANLAVAGEGRAADLGARTTVGTWLVQAWVGYNNTTS